MERETVLLNERDGLVRYLQYWLVFLNKVKNEKDNLLVFGQLDEI